VHTPGGAAPDNTSGLSRRQLLQYTGAGAALAATAGFAPRTTKAAGKVMFLCPPWGVPPEAANLADFTAQTGIEVEVQSVPFDQVQSKVETASIAGVAPADVIYLSSSDAPTTMIIPGLLEPLDQCFADHGINPADIDRMTSWQLDGQHFGATSYVQMVMMDYNEQRLQQAGFTAPPTTWAELGDMARSIKEQGIDEYPISMGIFNITWFIMAMSLGDQLSTEDFTPTFADPDSGGRQAMRLILEWYHAGLISPEMLSRDTPHDIFLAGTGTFHQSWQGAGAVMNNPATSKQAPNVKYMLMPDQHFTYASDAGLGVSAFSEAKMEACQFVNWYLSPSTQSAIYDAYGLVPSRPAVQQELSTAGKIQQFELEQEQATYVRPLPIAAPWWVEFSTFVTESLKRGAQSGLEADAAIDGMAERWNTLKSEQG
jgi:multiple sugar transport system substrate-binding protein